MSPNCSCLQYSRVRLHLGFVFPFCTHLYCVTCYGTCFEANTGVDETLGSGFCYYKISEEIERTLKHQADDTAGYP